MKLQAFNRRNMRKMCKFVPDEIHHMSNCNVYLLKRYEKAISFNPDNDLHHNDMGTVKTRNFTTGRLAVLA